MYTFHKLDMYSIIELFIILYAKKCLDCHAIIISYYINSNDDRNSNNGYDN